MLSGINYPWSMFEGKPNYGCDFGVNVWGSHAGVTAHLGEVRADFEAIADIGLDVVRWFVFTDGRGGVRWEGERPSGLADGFFDDMDAALGIATETGTRLCLVLFDYSWFLSRADRPGVPLPEWLATTGSLARLIGALIDPLLDRYGTGGAQAALGRAIHSIDVINEPDWITRGLTPDRWQGFMPGKGRRPALSRGDLRMFVGDIADRVHRQTGALVTVGGARVTSVREWEEPAYGLDFVQVHSYPDIRYPQRDRNLFGVRMSQLGLSKPLLIGEFPANGDSQHPADHQPIPASLTDYLNFARDAGYLGAWPWSFKGVDAFGAVNADRMRAVLKPHRA
jgi:hypothetical protein